MLGTKTTLVADLLYGSIALSPLESRLISTRAFNRLHNVLQNSTVYFTYPSNRTSRFSHSLGVAKLAGELFRSGLLNASQDVVRAFLAEAKVAITERCETVKFQNQRGNLSEEFRPEFETLSAASSLDCQFYASMIIPKLSEEETGIYIVLLQAVRFAALMHDLGHPPFSHIVEFGLQNIYEKLKDQEARPDTMNAVQKKVLKQMVECLEQGDDAAFHEIVGFQVAESLLELILRELTEEKCPDAQRYALMQIKEVTQSILRDTGFFSTLHNLVSGDLDADRLDYVQRDLVTSGLSREPFRPDRLLHSYTLIQDSSSADKTFQFVPSIRGLNNLEDFYTQRFQLYKYVIFHHRVVKFDGLMQQCVEDLATKYLDQPEKGRLETTDGRNDGLVLSSDISGVWQILSRSVMSQSAQRENFFIQWDDAWLLGVLRREYFRIRRERDDKGKTEKQVLEVRLEELLSNRKRYHALFKRAECFLQVDHAFAEAVPDDFDWEGIGKQWDSDQVAGKRVADEFQLIKKFVRDLKAAKGRDKEVTTLVEGHGYLLTRIISLIRTLRGKRVKLGFIYEGAEEFRKTHQPDIIDVVVIPKALNPGVKNHFVLADNDGRPISLGKVSRVADELERAALLFPPFFTYLLVVAPEKFEDSLGKWRQEFGRSLWKAFSKLTNI